MTFPSGNTGVFVQAAIIKILWTRWFISSSNVFLTVPGTGKSKSKPLLADSVSDEVLFWFIVCSLLAVSSSGGRARELSGVSFTRAPFPFVRASPS